nr:mitochondrial carrier homolog 1 isoform X4 [Globicephala melas]
MAGAGAGAGARGGAAAGVEARARDPPPAHRAHPRHPRPAAQPSARRMDGASGGLGSGDNAPTTEALFVALGAGVTALSHPLLYVKLLIQVGHEPMPPTIGTNVLGRKVLYLPSFFTYAKYIVQVDGKIGLFRGLSPRLMSNALSTVTRGSMKKVFPPDEIEQVANKDDMKTSLKKVVKETSYEMMMQCVSRMLAHPLHVISMRCMVQFVGREAKYSGVLSSIGKIFKEEGLLGFFVCSLARRAPWPMRATDHREQSCPALSTLRLTQKWYCLSSTLGVGVAKTAPPTPLSPSMCSRAGGGHEAGLQVFHHPWFHC